MSYTPKPKRAKLTEAEKVPLRPAGPSVSAAMRLYDAAGKPAPFEVNAEGKPTRVYSAEWDAVCDAISLEVGYPICGSFARQRGIPCSKVPLKGRPNCREHDGAGAAWAGEDNPNYSTGEHVGHAALQRLPKDKRAIIRSAMAADAAEIWDVILADPGLMDLDPYLASIQTRIAAATARVRDMEGIADQWETVKSAHARYERIMAQPAKDQAERASRNAKAAERLATEVERAVEGYVATHKAMAEIRTEEAHLDRFVGTETTRREAARNSLTAQQAELFALALLAIVKEEMPSAYDRVQLRVGQEMARTLQPR
jgi:hypothetical protein